MSLTGRSRGGGVLVAFSNKLKFDVVDISIIHSQIPLVDIVVCKCVLSYAITTLILLYIPPDISFSDFEHLLDLLEIFIIDCRLILIGDFNLPTFSMSQGSNTPTLFLSFIRSHNLEQVNNISNSNNRLLDLVLTNLQSSVSVDRDTLPFVSEDDHHPALSILLNISSPRSLPSLASNNNKCITLNLQTSRNCMKISAKSIGSV